MDEAREQIKAMFTDDSGVPLKMAEHKPKISLVPKEGIEGLARIYEYGLEKYQKNSWRKFTPEQALECLPDAGLRHLLSFCDGEEIDPDSGLPHLLQAAWNCITLHIILDRKMK
jgi:hypothetical protein